MIFEAKREIPWTKPEDIPYDARKPLPKFGGRHPGVFLAAFYDGSVRAISQQVDEPQLRALITPDGGEPVNINQPIQQPQPGQQPQRLPPTLKPTAER
jgi:hypothetical protein